MNPYRTPSWCDAVPAAAPHSVRSCGHDLGCMVMFAVGGLVMIAGVACADGMELAGGALTLMAGFGRLRRIHFESLMNSSTSPIEVGKP